MSTQPPYIELNATEVNGRLIDPKLTEADRDFIHGQIQRGGTRGRSVRVTDSARIRALLRIADDVKARGAKA